MKKVLKKSLADDILEIEFKKNFSAKIKVSDSVGTRVIDGKWSSEKTENYIKAIEPNIKKVLGVNVNPFVTLEYLRNGKGLNIISFSKEITSNNQLVLKSGEIIFEKK